MKLKQRLSTAYKVLTSQTLGNSLGSVVRNHQQGTLAPVQQVRGITYKVIDKTGQAISVYRPLIKQRNGNIVDNHPLYNLAENPNPRYGASDFFHLYSMLTDIYGETFWYKVRGDITGKVKELYLLNPAQVELKIENGELVGYILHKANGTQVPFLPEEIYHDKQPNPFNEWRGLSVLERASLYVDTEITTSQFTLSYMQNNASPSGIVSLPDMDKNAFQQFAQQWREGYEGPTNAGKTAFIRGGEASFKAVGATLRDVDQKVTREMAKDDVLMMFDMPKGLLGASGEKGLGRNELEPLEYIFSKYKIEPMMNRLDGIWQDILGVKDSSVEITHDSPIPEDKQFIQQQNKELVNIALTVNEVRERIGLPPIKGGDEIQPKNVVQPEPAKTARKIVMKKDKPIEKKSETRKINQEQEAFRSELVKNNDVYATKIKRAMSRFAGTQEFNVIDKINASNKAFEEWLFSVKDESEALTELLVPIFIELMEEQGKDVANFITGELLTISPEMRTTVTENIKQIAGVYNADTIKALEVTLSEGQTAGESLVKLKKRVESVYEEAKGYRAERIARTESLRASNLTAEQVYFQNGYSKVEWFTNPGACEFCRTYSGRTKAINGNFTQIGDVITGAEGGQMRIEYSDVPTPPLHPNCTCSLVPAD